MENENQKIDQKDINAAAWLFLLPSSNRALSSYGSAYNL